MERKYAEDLLKLYKEALLACYSDAGLNAYEYDISNHTKKQLALARIEEMVIQRLMYAGYKLQEESHG